MPRRDLVAFLPDEDSFGLGAFIRHHPALTYADVGLRRGASDEKVAEHAREHSAIVITRNIWDFRRVMRDAAEVSIAGECQAMHCHEGGGLVTVDRDVESFHFERITRAMRLGDQPVDWDDVYLLNLLVRISAGDVVRVGLLRQCERCLQRHAPECTRCQELRILELYEAEFQSSMNS